jgi:hypothetical protein
VRHSFIKRDSKTHHPFFFFFFFAALSAVCLCPFFLTFSAFCSIVSS